LLEAEIELLWGRWEERKKLRAKPSLDVGVHETVFIPLLSIADLRGHAFDGPAWFRVPVELNQLSITGKPLFCESVIDDLVSALNEWLGNNITAGIIIAPGSEMAVDIEKVHGTHCSRGIPFRNVG